MCITPRISFIIPVYNTVKLVERCINSILQQGLVNYEIIAVNDGSTDNSLDVLNDIKQRNNHVKVICQQNSGASAARNRGIESAEGEYLMFVDSDDYLLSGSLMNAIENAFSLTSNPDIIYTGYQRIGIDGKAANSSQENHIYCFPEIKSLSKKFDQLYFGSPCMKLFSRRIINNYNVRFNPTMKYFEDICFNYDFVQHCNSAVSVSNIVYCYDCYSNAGSHVTASCVSDQWIKDLKIYAQTMDAYGNSIKDYDINGGGYFLCYQIVYAIFNIYRSNNKNKLKWLHKILDLGNLLVPHWTSIPQKGIIKLIARSSAISPNFCHIVCSVIFNIERTKNNLFRH